MNSASGLSSLKWIVDSRKHSRTVASVADIDIPHDGRPCNGPAADTCHLVQATNGESRAIVENGTHIHEGLNLERRTPAFNSSGDRVAVVVPALAETPQRLPHPDDGLPPSQAA